jgi:predicted ATP-grasp superfamily ATP-dependent carboligase
VRNPGIVADCLTAAGLHVPALHRRLLEPPPPGLWLVKPLRGAGGSGIRFWGEEGATIYYWDHVYLQEYVQGEPCSALYAALDEQVRFLGFSRQLIGERWLHAASFHYCGSIGPLLPEPDLLQQLERLGATLAAGTILRGLFGVDGVLRNGIFWPVEVNPRYTASVEVLEYATGLGALNWHRQAFEPQTPSPTLPAVSPTFFVGKAILFAQKDLTFPRTGPWETVLRSPPSPTEMPAFADIPPASQEIKAGRPILTFFARADSVSGCEDLLRRIAADLDSYFY